MRTLRLPLLIPALVVLATLAAFWPVLGNDFVNWDDSRYLLSNPHFRGLGLRQIRWMFTTTASGPYQPLAWLTFGLDYLIWGMDPFGYHLTNLILHCANAALFYFLCLALFRASTPHGSAQRPSLLAAAGFAALLFALHPLRVESVAWAIERRDVLSLLFYLLTLIFYVKAHGMEKGRRSARWAAASLAAFLFSLLSKGMGIMLPVILVLLDIYPLRRLRGDPRAWLAPKVRGRWSEKVPYLVLALIFGLIGWFGQEQAGATMDLASYGIAQRSAQALYGLAFYLYKTLAPFELSPLYTHPSLNPTAFPYIISGIVVALVTIGAALMRRRLPAVWMAWLYYVVTLLPVLGLIPIGSHITADRYTYFSCLGWAAVGGGLLRSYLDDRKLPSRHAFLLGALLLPVALGALTWKQTRVWRNTESLWGHVLSIDPDNIIAHNNLANTLAQENRLGEASAHYREILALNPNYAPANNNLGILFARQGRYDEAIVHFRRALEIDPESRGALENLRKAARFSRRRQAAP